MIIVEGPDGAGKTTLIQAIQKAYPDLELAPRVVSKDAEAMVDLKQWVDDNLLEGFQYKLFDRHRLVSEFIYGPILRQKQEPGFIDSRWVGGRLAMFDKIEPLIIYCLPPLETVAENIYNSGDENRVVLDHIESIYVAYLQRAWLDMELRPRSTWIYDYTFWREEKDPLTLLHLPINEAYERAKNSD